MTSAELFEKSPHARENPPAAERGMHPRMDPPLLNTNTKIPTFVSLKCFIVVIVVQLL